MTRLVRLTLFLTLVVLLSGCGWAEIIAVGAGAMPVDKYVPTNYDSPPQTIYRIDSQRYFTIENYEDCSEGGDVYYHDTRIALKTKVGPNGIGIWPGLYRINPDDTHIALPSYSCGDKGCYLGIRFSTDGGKTFERFATGWRFGFHFSADEGGKHARVLVTKNAIYALDNEISIYRWTFDPGMRGDEVENSLRDHDKNPFPVPAVKTPTGQERFHCDTTIKPKNLPKTSP